MISTHGGVPKLPLAAVQSNELSVFTACCVVFCHFASFSQGWRWLLPCKVGQNLSKGFPGALDWEVGNTELSALLSCSFLQRHAGI